MNATETTWIATGESNQWLTEDGSFLSGCFANTYSQFGEDGLIGASLERFGVANQWCFEVGANDGVFYSNTLKLRENGWNAVLIEAEPELHVKCSSRFQSDRVHCYCATVSGFTLDWLLEKAGAPKELDLGVIDVDGQDYWVWKRFERHRPRLLLIEYQPHNPSDMMPVEDAKNTNDATGANWQHICSLGDHKGYAPLARTYCNLLFARNELLCQ